MPTYPQPSSNITEKINAGLVIPTHPLALTDDGKFDERSQRALTRYYAGAGVGGVAVAVGESGDGLLEAVYRQVANTLDELEGAAGQGRVRLSGPELVRVAGVSGLTEQAVGEAMLAAELKYHAALLNLDALAEESEEAILAHCDRVAQVIAIIGFNMQPANNGRRLSYDFWRRFTAIPNVVAIRMAGFDRYQTLDVVRAVACSDRRDEIALYTGDAGNLVVDLLTPFQVMTDDGNVVKRIVGGILGHWSVWTEASVKIFNLVQSVMQIEHPVPPHLLTVAAQIADMNAALFDAANDCKGAAAGVQHVLQQQGLVSSTRCLDEADVLSAGQADEIERVMKAYPHLLDGPFVEKHLAEWLR